MIRLTLRIGKFIDTGRSMVVGSDWEERGMGSYCLRGTDFLRVIFWTK